MKYRLMFSDYDGTFGVGTEIDVESVAAVKKFEQKGGKFVICTGRMYCSIIKTCRKYGLKGLVISYQGAMINEIETGKTVLSGGVPQNLALSVFNDMKKEGMQPIAEIDDVLYYDYESDLIKTYEKIGDVNMRKIPDVIEFVKNTERPFLKVCGVCEIEKTKFLTEKFAEKYKGKLIINNGAPYLVEAVNPAYTKGNAVRFIAKRYGIPLKEVIAIGDSTNDLELVGGPWRGVAVGDGSEELKKVTDEVTVPYKSHPVKTILEKYCL